MKKTLFAGASRINITPKVPLPLYGMGNDYVRKENFVFPKNSEDFLCADVLALSDGEKTVLVCTLDMLFIHDFLAEAVKKSIANALEIKEENIILTASHTHSGVSVAKPDEDVQEYNCDLADAVTKAAKAAVSDLAEAKLFAGSIKTEGLNFLRRFVMKDGTHRCTVADKNFNADDISAYETTPDNFLRALRITRKGKKDIVLLNWQAHPGFTASFTKGNVSADYIGSLRTVAESDPNTHLIFFQGAAGNMEARTRFKGDAFYEKSRSYNREFYAKELWKKACEIDYEEAKIGELCVKTTLLTVKQKKGKEILDETHSLPLSVITFGDVAICTAPNELYSDSGLDLRRRSPYKITLLCTNANGCFGYLPIKECFDNESFNENSAGDSFGVRASKCECSTAERVVDTLAKMLI